MLANRLGDPSAATQQSYWSPTELNLYLFEALRVWACAANYWTAIGVFTTTYGAAWYDLSAELPAQLGNTVTDQQLVNLIQYQLLEPITTSWPTWTGTEQFSMSDIVEALQRRRNQFLEETGIYLNLPTEYATTPANNGIVTLNDHSGQIRRVAWKAPDVLGQLDINHGTFTQLPRTDTFAADALLPGWSVSAGTPSEYIPYYATALTQFQLVPRPNDIGRVEVLSVNSPPDLDVSIGTVMGMDDDFTAYVKWGALADLLAIEGLANDAARSQYCEQRYREGVELAKISSTLTQAKVNGVPIPYMALDDFDFQIAGWQNEVAEPVEVACGNSNLIALHPVPDNIYSVECVVVRNAVLPASDGAFVQVGRQYLDAIIGEAQHVASFKMGGQEFTNTYPLHEQMFRLAAEYNGVLQSNLTNLDILGSTSTREQNLRPAA